jgi:hypothetical protein
MALWRSGSRTSLAWRPVCPPSWVHFPEQCAEVACGGVPVVVQLWQLFAGAKKRQVPGHYQALLLLLADGGGSGDGVGGLLQPAKLDPHSPYKVSHKDDNIMEKWTAQIEKVRRRSASQPLCHEMPGEG